MGESYLAGLSVLPSPGEVFGYLVEPGVIGAFFVSLPLLTMDTVAASLSIPDYDYDVFAGYASRRLVIGRELCLPHLLPALRSNIHLGFLIAVKAAMLAEWFAAQDGFGPTIRAHYQFFAMRRLLPTSYATRVPEPGAPGDHRHPLRGTNPHPGGQERRAEPERRAESYLRVEGLSFGCHGVPLFGSLSIDLGADRPTVLHSPSGCGETRIASPIVTHYKEELAAYDVTFLPWSRS